MLIFLKTINFTRINFSAFNFSVEIKNILEVILSKQKLLSVI